MLMLGFFRFGVWASWIGCIHRSTDSHRAVERCRPDRKVTGLEKRNGSN